MMVLHRQLHKQKYIDLKIEILLILFAPNDEMQDAIAFTNTYTATSTWNRINNKVTESILDSKNWCTDNLELRLTSSIGRIQPSRSLV
ncbi:MAG: hypothetical protein IPN93_07140 [Bacteroidetes bacterium]|nr:hypothetical protein [Bacteroidota bacterium]